VLLRDEPAGSYRVDHVYRHDPDEPDRAAPLSRPGVDVKAGDVIESINGTPVLSVADASMLLRRKAGRQVLLRVKPKTGEARDVVVTPTTPEKAADLRYHEWEHTRRLAVDEMGKGEIGYVHLRAMGGDNFTEWARNFYPVFTRQGRNDARTTAAATSIAGFSHASCKAWFHWTHASDSSRPGTCSTPSADTWWSSATSSRPRTVRRSRREFGDWGSGR
jgi:tricorn protease